MVKYTVLSPIHNEEENLEELVKRTRKTMKKYSGNSWEYLLIDDKSTDDSSKILKKFSKKYKNVKTVRHKKQKGQTGCFDTGFKKAKGNVIITMDGDLQISPEDIPKLLDKINGNDIANAVRLERKHPIWMIFASKCYNVLMQIFFRSPASDNASNFTAVKSKYLKGLSLQDNDHRYLIPILLRRGAKKVADVPIIHNTRKGGKSKYTALPKYIKGFPEIFQAWYRINSGQYD